MNYKILSLACLMMLAAGDAQARRKRSRRSEQQPAHAWQVSELKPQKSLAPFGVPSANYSGITPLGDNRYAIIDDKAKCDGFSILQLDIDPKTGDLRSASHSIPDGYARRMAASEGTYRDMEGIAFCEQRNSVFISGEEDMRILEYTLDGHPTGTELEVPEHFGVSNRRPNYGFEALTYNSRTERFWTTTESTLLSDGDAASLASPMVENKLRLQSFDLTMKPSEELIYRMDAPQVKGGKGTYIHGVPSLLALDDGQLLVMEREEYVPKTYLGAVVYIKIYVVDTSKHDNPVEKRLLTEFSTTLRALKMNIANYEGMCLGPKLEDGRQTLVLLCDSQGGMGNALYHLKDYVKVLVLE